MPSRMFLGAPVLYTNCMRLDAASAGKKGFTLIELLIVIGILAVLATTTVLVLNPAELFRQARDAQRVSDLDVLKKTMSFLQVGGKAIGLTNIVYISATDYSDGCYSLVSSLPALASGWYYNCSLQDPKKLNGTGWLPFDFSNPLSVAPHSDFLAAGGNNFSTAGATLTTLPLDPKNVVTGGLYYQYITDTANFEFTTKFESTKFQEKAQTDGGYDTTRYETGSDMTLWKAAAGL